MQIIDGKTTAKQIKQEIAKEVEQIIADGGIAPHLAAIIVGSDPASETYIASKVKACKEVGFRSTLLRFDSSVSETNLLETIEKINNQDEVDGLIVQLPLPGHISKDKVIEAVWPGKDVDGFHPENVGKMVIGLPTFIAATPAGILELLKRYEIETAGKHCVVLGRSNIVGTPMGILMSRKEYPGNSTVTICHSRTQNLKEITKEADILIAAIGKKEFVTADMVKEGAVVVDVGIHREKSNKTKSGWKLYGDVKFDEVSPKCSFITPVPGGVGPMTIVSLLKNTLISVKRKMALKS